MKYRAIISDAWALTQENKKLIWYFAFVPAILSTIVTIGYLGYQGISFWQSPYINPDADHDSVLGLVFNGFMNIFSDNPGLGALLIFVAVLLFVIYTLLPVFTQGALIQLVAKIRAGYKVSIMEGIAFGFNRFLQLLEYHLLIKTFSLFGILTEASLVFRSFGPEAFAIFGWIFLLFGIVALFFTLIFTYSEYFLVIDKKGVFDSILASSGLVFRQWQHTLFMLLLMTIISVRIIINIFVALLIPTLIVAPIFLFASLTLTTIGVIVGSIIGAVALYFTSYFVGVLHVFSTAVWTFTFMDLTNEDSVNLRDLKPEVQE